MTWATHGRTSSNSNERGNSKQRKARKLWLLKEFGDGEKAPCSFEGCETVLTIETITVDRFPILGADNGTYRHGNIRPACGPCNLAHGITVAHQRRAEKREREKQEQAA